MFLGYGFYFAWFYNEFNRKTPPICGLLSIKSKIIYISYAKQAQKKQITEFLFDNLHIWCGRQELKQLNKSENGGFLRENGQKRLVFLILPVRSPWAKSIF